MDAKPSHMLVHIAAARPGFVPGTSRITFQRTRYQWTESPVGGKLSVEALLKDDKIITTSGLSRYPKKSTK
jgi:hypothetical protein